MRAHAGVRKEKVLTVRIYIYIYIYISLSLRELCQLVGRWIMVHYPGGMKSATCYVCRGFLLSEECSSTYSSADPSTHKSCLCYCSSSTARAACCARGLANAVLAYPCFFIGLLMSELRMPELRIVDYFLCCAPGIWRTSCDDFWKFKRECIRALYDSRKFCNSWFPACRVCSLTIKSWTNGTDRIRPCYADLLSRSNQHPEIRRIIYHDEYECPCTNTGKAYISGLNDEAYDTC